MRAVFQGVTVAESNTTVEVDGIWYFPKTSVNHEYLANSERTSFCPQRGHASYFHIRVNDSESLNSVFVYPDAAQSFGHIRGWYGFWMAPDAAQDALTIRD